MKRLLLLIIATLVSTQTYCMVQKINHKLVRHCLTKKTLPKHSIRKIIKQDNVDEITNRDYAGKGFLLGSITIAAIVASAWVLSDDDIGALLEQKQQKEKEIEALNNKINKAIYKNND